jgi:hypothetical protein
MRSSIIASLALLAAFAASPASANDSIAQCREFVTKFQRCVDSLQGEKQDEARVFLRTIRAMLGMSDDLNRGDPMMMSIMCSATMDEAKKDPSVKAYNCAW